MDATLQRVAAYVCRARFDALPEDALHEARRRIIDSIACAAAASTTPFCTQLLAFSRRYSGTPAARLWGCGALTSLEMAAFANGTLVRYLDYSDTVLSRSNGHPSDMVAGLVATAESLHRDGAALLTAIVLAYEVYCSFCAAVPWAAHAIDQSTAAAVGAAAGAAHLMGLSAAKVAHALALALSANVNLYSVRCGELSDWKGCAGPNGVRNGLFAALLAREGLSGPSGAVEGRGGLRDMVGAFHWEPGRDTGLLITQTHLKTHAVCYHGQSAVDAALMLREQVPAQYIEGISIETYDAAFQTMGADDHRWAPTNRETADHSMPYTVAYAWLHGRLGPEAYDDHSLRDDHIRALMQRVRVQATPELTRAFPEYAATRITVRNITGSVHTHFQQNPRGNAANPLSNLELESKFIELIAPWGGRGAAERLLDTLWRLEHMVDVSELVDMLCTHSP